MTGTTPSTTAGAILRRMRTLPHADLDVIAPGTSLVLAPHPDDETLGCGGLIVGCCERGRPPVLVAVTDGAGSHPDSRTYPPPRLRAVRAGEFREAAALLGVPAARVHFLGLPDTQAPRDGPAFDGTVTDIVALIRRYDVATVFASWAQDPHCDHQATAALATAAADQAGVRVRFYPVWGWLLPDDQPLPLHAVAGARLDVRAARERKRQALAAHASQYGGLIDDTPHGFQLPAELLAIADQDDEVFLQP
jgi:LmbE family N-acetylglucosaminyl deacetylase